MFPTIHFYNHFSRKELIDPLVLLFYHLNNGEESFAKLVGIMFLVHVLMSPLKTFQEIQGRYRIIFYLQVDK